MPIRTLLKKVVKKSAGLTLRILPPGPTGALIGRYPQLICCLPSVKTVKYPRYLGEYTVMVDTIYPIEREMLSGVYDPLTVRRDPNNANRFIRDPFPNNIIPANRIVNPLYQLYSQMVPSPNQNFVENGTTPSSNYYQGGQPDSPASHLYAGRVDVNLSPKNRVFVRASVRSALSACS